jgi:small-conductance mechanosensitive channel
MQAFFLNDLHAHARDMHIAVIALCLAIVLAYFLHAISFRLLHRVKKQDIPQTALFRILDRLRGPARAILIFSAIFFALQFVSIPPNIATVTNKAIGIFWFLALGWLMAVSVYLFEDLLLSRYAVAVADSLRGRRIRTQLQVLRRLALGLVAIVDLGLVLSVFHDSRIWQYGAGLLASAGVASLVLATAAKSTVANVLAGIQIAVSEPFRIDDVVIVEGEWGKIEEITSSYVVVNIWDKRRLIVPLTYFIEQPFQNWTRRSSDLLGTAFLYVDYSVSVELLREELTRILKSCSQWDGLVNSVQVTNLSEHTMEIRCLVSSDNSSDLFDLRCIIREKMIEFLRTNYPDAFPQMRLRGSAEQGFLQLQRQPQSVDEL